MSAERPAFVGKPTPAQGFLDRLGIAVTSLCAVHCLALTLVLWLYPVLWFRREVFGLPMGWLVWFELVLAAVGIGAAALAFVTGWRTHGRLGPGVLFGAGVALLAYGVYGAIHTVRYWGTAAVVAAGLLLVAGHLWNLRLSRRFGCRQGA